MSSEARRQREREELRGRILEAARELFVAEGYDAVTMRKIAEKIDYSPTALYFHFADKAALVRELVSEDFLKLASLFERAARVADPIERLKKAAAVYVDFAERHPNHYRLMFMTPHPNIPLRPEDRARLGNPDQDAYCFLRLTVEEAMEKQQLRPELKDPDLVAQLLWSAVHGVIALQIAKCEEDWIDWRPTRKVSATLVEALLRGLLVSPVARAG